MTHHHLQALSLGVAIVSSVACFELWPEPSSHPRSSAPKVRGGEIAFVSVVAAVDSVQVGDGVMFNYQLRPPAGKTLPSPDPRVSWASSDTAVAIVFKNGWVVGRGVGVATISATVRGVVGAKIVTVTAPRR